MTNDASELKGAASVTDGTRIVVADGSVLTAQQVGTVEMLLDDNIKLCVHGVLYIPGLDKKLLAVAKIIERGVRVSFTGNVCELSKGGETFLTLNKGSHGLFSVKPKRVLYDETATEAIVADGSSTIQLWHARLGHPSFASIGNIQKHSKSVPQAAGSTRDPNELCEGCAQGKMTVTSFPRNPGPNKVKSSTKLHLIHSDVAGPFKTPTPAGRRYVVTFVDATQHALVNTSNITSNIVSNITNNTAVQATNLVNFGVPPGKNAMISFMVTSG
ncbi:hypothetical protein PC128_g13130 [Phytophthora cactorum]|nr:hypothetical protein PC128_g13130 [Phytophthora cactorum]